MGYPMVSKGFAMAASTTLHEHPPIGSVQVRDSGKHPSTPDHPHQRQQFRDKSSYALGTPDFFTEDFTNIDHQADPLSEQNMKP
jgi:hypothetical protein